MQGSTPIASSGAVKKVVIAGGGTTNGATTRRSGRCAARRSRRRPCALESRKYRAQVAQVINALPMHADIVKQYCGVDESAWEKR